MADNPQNEHDNVMHLNGSQRLFERYKAQHFGALINRRPAHIVNWSQGGIAIIDRKNRYILKQQVDIRLQLPTDEGQLKNCSVKAEVVHITEGGYIGFQFIDVSPATAGMLHYMVNCYRQQIPVQVRGIEAAASAAVLQRNQDIQTNAKVHPTRHIIALAVLAGLLFIIGSYLHYWFFRLESPYAAITAPAITLTAPSDGRVLLSKNTKNTTAFKKGQPLLHIENMDLMAEQKAVKIQTELQQQRLAVLESQLKKAGRNAYYQRKAAKSVSQQRLAEGVAATAMAEQAEKAYQRTENLYDKGHVTAEQLQIAEQEFKTTQATLAAVKAQLQEANERAEVAEIFNNKDTPDEVLRDIALVNAEIDFFSKKQELLEQQLQQIKLDSPCDCKPVELLVADGSWVKEGAPLMVLQYPETTVEALISWQNVPQLSTGTQAVIKLADNTTIQAKIKAIEGASNQQMIGLPKEMSQNPQYARIILATHQSIIGKPGQPLTVIFKTPNRLLNKLWFLQ